MAVINLGDVVYPTNYLGTETGAQIKGEDYTLTPANGKNYVTLVPRAAPFFRKGMIIINAATGAELVEDRDYTLGWLYNNFSQQLYKGLYGCITFNNLSAPLAIKMSYSTLGAPFVLDGAAYAQIAANAANNPRSLFWEQIANPPATYPPVPHIHPADQTMDYQQYIDAMKVGQAVIINAIATYQQALSNHTGLIGNVHGATAADFLLGNVQNYAMAVASDVQGNSEQLYVSVAMAKRIYQYMFTGLPPVALDSAVLPELLTAKATTSLLTDLNSAGLLTAAEQTNVKEWQVYVGALIVKACKGTTTVITPPAKNDALGRLLGM